MEKPFRTLPSSGFYPTSPASLLFLLLSSLIFFDGDVRRVAHDRSITSQRDLVAPSPCARFSCGKRLAPSSLFLPSTKELNSSPPSLLAVPGQLRMSLSPVCSLWSSDHSRRLPTRSGRALSVSLSPPEPASSYFAKPSVQPKASSRVVSPWKAVTLHPVKPGDPFSLIARNRVEVGFWGDGVIRRSKVREEPSAPVRSVETSRVGGPRR